MRHDPAQGSSMLASAADVGPTPRVAPGSAAVGPTAAHPHAPPACWHGGAACDTTAPPHGASAGAAVVGKGRRADRAPHVLHEQ